MPYFHLPPAGLHDQVTLSLRGQRVTGRIETEPQWYNAGHGFFCHVSVPAVGTILFFQPVP